MIEVKALEKRYASKKGPDTVALDGVSIAFGKGFNVILGRSGCGKSTLLNLMAGLDGYDGGEIYVDGKAMSSFSQSDMVAYRRKKTAFVFQDFNLVTSLTAGENAAMALDLCGEDCDKDAFIKRAFERVGMAGCEGRRCNELSGGQKQRVAIVRAIVKSPDILFADEPTGNLDSITGEEIFELLRELSSDACVIAVTHDEEYAYAYADRVVRMEDGKVVSDEITDRGRALSEAKEPSSETVGTQGVPKKNRRKGSKASPRLFAKIGVKTAFLRPFRMLLSIALLAAFAAAFGLVNVMSFRDGAQRFVEQNINGGVPRLQLGSILSEKAYNVYGFGGEAAEYLKDEYADRGVIPIYGNRIYVPDYFGVLYLNAALYSEASDAVKLAAGEAPDGYGEAAITAGVAGWLLRTGISEGYDRIELNGYEDILGRSFGGYRIVGIVDNDLPADVYALIDKVLKENDPSDPYGYDIIRHEMRQIAEIAGDTLTLYVSDSEILGVSKNSFDSDNIDWRSSDGPERVMPQNSAQDSVFYDIPSVHAVNAIWLPKDDFVRFVERGLTGDLLDRFEALESDSAAFADAVGSLTGFGRVYLYLETNTETFDFYTLAGFYEGKGEEYGVAYADDSAWRNFRYGTLTVTEMSVGLTGERESDLAMISDIMTKHSGETCDFSYRIENSPYSHLIYKPDQGAWYGLMSVLNYVLIAVSALLMLNTQIATYSALKRQIGAMQSMGASKGHIALIFLIQSLIIAVSAVAAGSAVVAVAVDMLNSALPFTTLCDVYVFTPGVFAHVAGAAFAVATAGAVIVLIRTAFRRPIKNLRGANR